MNYKAYAEAKIANPDCEIVTTGKNCAFVKTTEVIFEALLSSGNGRHKVSDDCWAICNPADYCSTLKEFLEAGLKLVKGDKFIGVNGNVIKVKAVVETNIPNESDEHRYILSAAAISGGCKIPKTELWTVYNNTLPLSALTDEQYGKMRRAHDAGNKVEVKQVDTLGWCVSDTPLWDIEVVYRVKQKSKRELFIEASVQLMTSETERTMEQMFGAQFDAGARYKDLTHHFGENI